MATIHNITTADELLRLSAELGRCELVRGELLMMSPSGFDHSSVVAAITELLRHHVRRNRLGIVAGAEGGYRIERKPDTVRAPDVSFVVAQRIPPGRRPGFFDGPPDLAVEVTSPNDRLIEVQEKIRIWLAAGCRLVWVVDPETRTVTAYAEAGQSQTFSGGDGITGGAVLPDFRASVAEFFADLDE